MDTLSTSSSSSSSNSQGAAVPIQAAPQNPAPPNQWEATAGFIAVGIFQSAESFSDFKHSKIAEKFIALRLSPEAFDGQLIGAIGRQLVLGVVDQQSLCRAAWAFQKLGIRDDEVKASLEAKALEILRSSEPGANEQTLILDITAQLGKTDAKNDELLIALVKEVDRLFQTMEPPVELPSKLKALKSLNSLKHGSPQAREIIVSAIQKQITAVEAHIHNQGFENHRFSLLTKAFGFDLQPKRKPHDRHNWQRLSLEQNDPRPHLAQILLKEAKWQKLSVEQMIQARVILNKHFNINEDMKLILWWISHGIIDQKSLRNVSFKEVTRLISALPDLAGLEGAWVRFIYDQGGGVPGMNEEMWVNLLSMCAERVILEKPSLSSIPPDQIVILIRGLGFGMQFDKDATCQLDGDDPKVKFRKAMKKAKARPVVRKAIEVLVTRLVNLGVGDHLRADCLADLVERIGKSELTPELEQASMDLLGSQLVTPQGLAAIDKHQMEKILATYLNSRASDAIKELVITSLAQKISEETFQRPSRVLDEENECYLRAVRKFLWNSNLLNLCDRFSTTVPWITSRGPEATAQVRNALSTLGSLLADIAEDPGVFEDRFLPFWNCLRSTHLLGSLNAEQVGRFIISLHQTGIRAPKHGCVMSVGHNTFQSGSFREFQESLARAFAKAEEPGNLTGERLAGISQALGHAHLRSEQIAPCVNRLAQHLHQDGMVDSLTDAQLVYATQGLGLPGVYTEPVISAMTMVVNKLKAKLETSSDLAISDDIEIALALCGLSRHKHLSADVSDVMNLLAIHLSQDLSALSDDLVCDTLYAISKTDRPDPGVASVMYRLIQRWKQLGELHFDHHLRASWTYVKNSSSESDRQPPRDVRKEMHSLARWLAHPEVMAQLSPMNVIYLLTLFSNLKGVAEGVQATIEAMGARLANEKSIDSLVDKVIPPALWLFLQTGFGTQGVAAATERLISRWLALPDPQKTVAAEQVAVLLAGIQKSRMRSENIDLLISALCQNLVRRGSYLPLSTAEIASCTKALQEFGIQSDEVLAAWCTLARWIKDKLGYPQPNSDPKLQEQLFQMILCLNELPNTPEILKVRDDFASHLGSHPEVVKAFSLAQVGEMTESYARLDAPSNTIASTLEKLQKRLRTGR